MEEKFYLVRQYIDDNPGADIGEVSEANEVPIKQIERWIREERLSFTADSPIGIPCEWCGKTIKSGRYCSECADKLGNTLKNLYSSEEEAEHTKQKSKGNKMRYIEHEMGN
jgi:methionyl-tRNA synthetase